MAIYQRPGVYVEETLNLVPPVVGSASTSVAAFVGASDRGPLVPTLVNSWSQYVKAFGSWNSNNSNSNDLPFAVFSFFSNGGSSAYIQRAIGSGSDLASVTLTDSLTADALTLTAVNQGTWGNNIYASVSNVKNLSTDLLNPEYVYDLTLYYGGITSAYSVERYSGISNDPASSRFVENVLLNSNYVTATAVTTTYPAVSPSPVAFSGGLDGATVTESVIAGTLDSFDVIKNSLILNACGVTTSTYVNQVISYAESRQDVFVIIDPSGTTSAGQISINESYAATSFAASYYPKITVADPTVSTRGATTVISPSGSIMGLYASTDVSRGVFKAPAGLQARLGGALSVPVLTNAELDVMNTSAAAANALRYIPGTGVVVMGARTLKAGYADKYIPVRRTLIYLRKALTDLTEFAVFEPNDQDLWNEITDVITKELTRFWGEGGLRGASAEEAFFVKCDSDNNTPSSIDEGIVNIEVGVALQRPAEFVVIKIGQFEGGATVTVA